MKKLVNALLFIAIIAMAFISYRSIMGPIEFSEERQAREKQVIARLIDIRTAQIEYRNTHDGIYAGNLDTLIDFIKTAKMPIVMKVGELDDKQLERGLTEKKALEIIAKAQKTNRWNDVKKEGLWYTATDTVWDEAHTGYTLKDTSWVFRRDTTWIALIDTIYPKGFIADSLAYVPFSNGVKFELDTATIENKSGYQHLFVARTPYATYLKGVNDQEMNNLISTQKKLKRYAGLKVGDIEMPNNNAGNWE